MSSKGKAVNVYATREDWRELLSVVESAMPVFYVKGGAVAHADPIESVNQIEGLGRSETGNSMSDPSYLCVDRGSDVRMRRVPQRNGGELCFVDQMENPNTLNLRFGGEFPGSILIAGQVGTVSTARWSAEAFGLVRSRMSKSFQGVQSYCLGREATVLFRQGWRLTSDVRSPETYDLRIGS